jgi:hypothetical protein
VGSSDGQAAIHPLSSVTRRRTVTVRQESDFFLPFVAVSAASARGVNYIRAMKLKPDRAGTGVSGQR